MTRDTVKALLEQYHTAMFNKEILNCGYGVEETGGDTLNGFDIYALLRESMQILKSYPSKGEMYYELLDGVYINDKPHDRKAFTEKYNISDVSYYRYRGRAIDTLFEIYQKMAERKSA